MPRNQYSKQRATFIPNGPSLESLTGFAPHTIRVQHSTKRGALSPILTKFGGRLGVWLDDWEALAKAQKQLRASGNFNRAKTAIEAGNEYGRISRNATRRGKA